MTEEQAGIYKIILYENKGVSFTYSGSVISAISNTGDVITLENSDCDTFELGFTFKTQRNNNNKLKYNHQIAWKQLGLNPANIEKNNQLKKSIYGWIPLIEFYNLDKKVVTNPLRFLNSDINNNISNHYEITLNNINFGNKAIDFVADFNYVFEDGNNFVFEDDNNFIFE